MDRFANPTGMEALLGDINGFEASSETPVEDTVEEIRAAFQNGQIDEQTYEEMLIGIGETSNAAGLS